MVDDLDDDFLLQDGAVLTWTCQGKALSRRESIGWVARLLTFVSDPEMQAWLTVRPRESTMDRVKVDFLSGVTIGNHQTSDGEDTACARTFGNALRKAMNHLALSKDQKERLRSLGSVGPSPSSNAQWELYLPPNAPRDVFAALVIDTLDDVYGVQSRQLNIDFWRKWNSAWGSIPTYDELQRARFDAAVDLGAGDPTVAALLLAESCVLLPHEMPLMLETLLSE